METPSPRTDRFSLVGMGVITGFFLQWSTLGANLMIASTPKDSPKNHVVSISLLWSIGTSVLGILVLAMIRRVLVASNRYCRDILLLTYESHFTVGGIGAVCAGWTVTSTMLGYETNAWVTLVGFSVAMGWCKTLVWVFTPAGTTQPITNEGMQQSLLEKDPTVEQKCRDIDMQTFRRASLTIGCITGIFVQLSSMGMNFVIQMIQPPTSWLFPISFGWSIIVAGLSASLLYLLRRLVRTYGNDNIHDISQLLWCLESYMSIGVLLGVNVSWYYTKIALGIHVSLWSVLLPMLWSTLLFAYFIRYDRPGSDIEVNDTIDRSKNVVDACGDEEELLVV